MNYLYFFWSLPIIEFMIFPTNLGKINLILIPTIYVFYSILKMRYEILVNSIPFFLLFSSLGHSMFGATFAELISILSFLILTWYIVKQKKYLISKLQIPIIGMFIYFILSFLVSFEYISLYKGLINGIGLFGVYGLTRIVIDDEIKVTNFIKTFIVAVTYASIIMLFSFYNGINLNSVNREFMSNVYNQQLLHAPFFYTNIFFLTTSAVIVSPSIINFNKNNFKKIIYFILMLIIIFGISKNFNKTAFVALSFAGSLFIIKLLMNRIKLKNIFFIIVIMLSLYILSELYLAHEQISGRLLGFASLRARVAVFESSYAILLENKHLFIFGLGPEALFRLGGNDIIISAKTHSRGTEGAIDSGYLSYLFEYGFIFLMLFATYVFSLIINLLFIKNKNLVSKIDLNNLSFALGLVCICVATISITQVLGLGKISATVFQIFACSETKIKKKKNSN